MKGRRVAIRWGRPQAQQNVIGQMGEGGAPSRHFEPVPGLPGSKLASKLKNSCSKQIYLS